MPAAAPETEGGLRVTGTVPSAGRPTELFSPWLSHDAEAEPPGSYRYGGQWETIDHLLLGPGLFDERGLSYAGGGFRGDPRRACSMAKARRARSTAGRRRAATPTTCRCASNSRCTRPPIEAPGTGTAVRRRGGLHRRAGRSGAGGARPRRRGARPVRAAEEGARSAAVRGAGWSFLAVLRLSRGHPGDLPLFRPSDGQDQPRAPLPMSLPELASRFHGNREAAQPIAGSGVAAAELQELALQARVGVEQRGDLVARALQRVGKLQRGPGQVHAAQRVADGVQVEVQPRGVPPAPRGAAGRRAEGRPPARRSSAGKARRSARTAGRSCRCRHPAARTCRRPRPRGGGWRARRPCSAAGRGPRPPPPRTGNLASIATFALAEADHGIDAHPARQRDLGGEAGARQPGGEQLLQQALAVRTALSGHGERLLEPHQAPRELVELLHPPAHRTAARRRRRAPRPSRSALPARRPPRRRRPPVPGSTSAFRYLPVSVRRRRVFGQRARRARRRNSERRSGGSASEARRKRLPSCRPARRRTISPRVGKHV